MTDAGYRNPWFREVEKHGRFWLSRVLGDVGFKRDGQTLWRSNKSFYPNANSRAKYLGCGELGRKNPLHAHLHLYKAKSKHRKDKRSSKAGQNHIAQQQHWERAFQANTTRHRRVLSIIRLGRKVRKRASDYKISEAQIRWAIGKYIGWVHKEGRPIL